MAISPTHSTVADYFFVTGLRDVDLLSTYDAVKNGQTMNNDAFYYNNQEHYATSTVDLASTRPKSPPGPLMTTPNLDSSLSSTHLGRKRGQSLPIYPTTSTTSESNSAQLNSLTGVMDHVQAVVEQFDKERNVGKRNVIALPTPPSPTNGTVTPCDRFRRASVNTVQPDGTRRASLNDTSWQRIRDSLNSPVTIKRTLQQQQRQRRYSMSHSTTTMDPEKGHQYVNQSDEMDDDLPTVPHLLDVKYPPTVLLRYPAQDSITPFPSYLSMFSFPHDISLYYGNNPPPERIHSFTMTDETGSTRYGTCCVFYEPLPDTLLGFVDKELQSWVETCVTNSTVEYGTHLQAKIDYERAQQQKYNLELASWTTKTTTQENLERTKELEELIRTSRESLILYEGLLEPVKLSVCTSSQIWVPKSVGVLGGMPWLELYSDWIKILLDSVVGVGGKKNKSFSIDVKSAVTNLIHEVPVPPPGRFEIGLSINDRTLYIARPAMNEVPLLKNFSLYPVFRALSPHLILAVLETLLVEGKVVFLSQHCGMLSLACESFRFLLFPLYWPFVFIPLLPARLLNCLQAPVPYIIGFQGDMNDIDEFVPEDACVVNLDSNTIHQSARAPMLPDRQRRKLQAAMEQYCSLHTRRRVPYGVPLSVQMAFPNGRLLLSCNRSKLQDVFETPASRNRVSESFDSSSLWSSTKSGKQLPRSSGVWNTSPSTRSSNESFGSQSMGTTDLSQQTMPQFPSFAKLAINPQAATSSSSLHSNSSTSSPISPTTETNHSSSFQQRSSMPVMQSYMVNRHGDKGQSSPSSLQKTQNRMSEPSPPRLSTPTAYDPTIHEGDPNRQLSRPMSKPRAAAFQQTEDQTTSPIYSLTMPLTTASATSVDTGMNYGHSGSYGQHYSDRAQREISRHVKHIEGHIMMTLYPQELHSFQGYRCLCGKQVDQSAPIQELYRICQECHLITHDACADQILHPCLPASFDETKIQDSVLQMFASLLYGYRAGFMDSMEHPISDRSTVLQDNNATSDSHHPYRQPKSTYFSKEAFLRNSDKDTREYLSNLAGSQMFSQFITDRLCKPKNDPEVLMFDEFIKLKLNRSKLKFVKEDTPFLNDESYRVSQVIWTTPPKNKPDRICKYNRFYFRQL
ncbi:AEX-3 domain-domain-containing protein [Absidia repens]|uniref:AEX-3 domain-domain-containing protein n=1 Tax=Absidia repens TaxID=90262 RepID=A0A1X2IPU3_9FUNG|nr:AEX-3 domain-domain-containing protein [Absidia repens]